MEGRRQGRVADPLVLTIKVQAPRTSIAIECSQIFCATPGTRAFVVVMYPQLTIDRRRLPGLVEMIGAEERSGPRLRL